MGKFAQEFENVIKKFLPPRTERDKVAKQIRWARNEERKRKVWENDRDSYTYDEALMGIGKSLDYVRQHQDELRSNIFVDVGAGKGRAATELGISDLGDGLDLHATNTTHHEEHKFLGKKMHITAAETMSGFEPSTVAYISSVFAAAYSDSPEAVIKTFDEKLVPGGIMKLALKQSRPISSVLYSHTRKLKGSTRFVAALEKLGYKIEENLAVRKSDHGHEVLLAIKPGNSIGMKADEIIDSDYTDWKERRFS